MANDEPARKHIPVTKRRWGFLMMVVYEPGRLRHVRFGPFVHREDMEYVQGILNSGAHGGGPAPVRITAAMKEGGGLDASREDWGHNYQADHAQIPVVEGKMIRRVLLGPFAASAGIRKLEWILARGGPEGRRVWVRISEPDLPPDL